MYPTGKPFFLQSNPCKSVIKICVLCGKKICTPYSILILRRNNITISIPTETCASYKCTAFNPGPVPTNVVAWHQ